MHGDGESAMIRPITFVCVLLACGSGLYLYQAKHRVQMIDREIEKTVHTTDELREQTRVLHAEWTLQNDPQRLQTLAEQFLNLKTVTPGQFTNLAELDSRLPEVRAPEPPPSEARPLPVAEAPPPEPPAAAVPPAPPPRPAVVAAASAPPLHPPERKPPARPVIAETQPVRATPVVARAAETAVQARPIMPTAVSAPMPVGGSALGMARSASVPLPRPMPVNASQWVNSGGGG
jgi:hypothetical protein